jgi:hypothetical protein
VKITRDAKGKRHKTVKSSKEARENPRWHIGAPMMPEYAAELGRVVALWSRLEHMMNGVICQLSGIGLNLGDVFLNNVNMIARHLILESVASRYLKEKDPKFCASLMKCSEEIREYRKRNQLVHGLRTRGGLEFVRTQHASRKDHKRQEIEWSLQDMIEVGNDISTLIMNLWGHIEMIDELFPQPPSEHRPWRRKPPLRPRTLQRLSRPR